MLKNIATWFGVVLLVVGVLGFIPLFAPNGMLLGLFEVGPVHNLVHLATGAAAVVMALSGEGAARLFFQIFGVVYAAVAVLGLFYGNAPLLGFMAHNWWDVLLHVGIAAFALYFGFAYRRPRATPGHV